MFGIRKQSSGGGSPRGGCWSSARGGSILSLQRSSRLTYHIPGASPGAFHCRLIDGLGFEARGGWPDTFGCDTLECQRTVPQVGLGPGRNLIGRMSCQVANWGNRDKGLEQWSLYAHSIFKITNFLLLHMSLYVHLIFLHFFSLFIF